MSLKWPPATHSFDERQKIVARKRLAMRTQNGIKLDQKLCVTEKKESERKTKTCKTSPTRTTRASCR